MDSELLTEIRAYVIGLEHSYRGAELERQLAEAGIIFTRIHGVVGTFRSRPIRDFTNDRAAKQLFGRVLTNGEIGCALAHHVVYAELLDTREEWALVLEDDARLVDADRLRRVLAQAQTFTSVDEPRIISLYGRKAIACCAESNDSADDDLIVRLALPPYTTTAYVLNRAAARLITENALPLINPADWAISVAGDVEFFASFPWVFLPEEEEFSSTVGDREATVSGLPARALRRATYEFRKFAARTHLLWLMHGRRFVSYRAYAAHFFTRPQVERKMGALAPYELPRDSRRLPSICSTGVAASESRQERWGARD